MKKINKILAGTMAAALSAAGVMSVSAANSSSGAELDKIVCRFNVNDSYYSECVMDENGDCSKLSLSTQGVLVEMKDGAEPVFEQNSGLKAEKFDKSTLSDIKNIDWIMNDIMADQYTDNMYIITGFSDDNEITEYCRNLVQEEKANIANIYCNINYQPFLFSYEVSDELKNDYGFDGSSFSFYVNFDSQNSAENFDISSVKNLSDNIEKTAVIDSKLNIQLKKGTSISAISEIFNSLEKLNGSYGISGAYVSGSVLDINNEPLVAVMSAFDKGDVNFDGKVDVFDAVAIAKSTVGGSELGAEQKFLSDYNKDSSVDVFDAIAVAKETVE